MLTRLIALKELQDAKQAARKEALEAIDAEFGDVDQQIKEERAKLLAHMKDNDMTFLATDEGVVEIRRSRPKYDVINDKALIQLLIEMNQWNSLSYVKSDVNTMAALGQIPDNVINIIYDDELVVRTK